MIKKQSESPIDFLYKLPMTVLRQLDELAKSLEPTNGKMSPLAKCISIAIIVKEREHDVHKAKTRREQKEHLRIIKQFKKLGLDYVY